MPSETAIALLSGGLDSAFSLWKAKDKYSIRLALTFDYGQRAAPKEIGAAAALCGLEKIPHRVMALPWLADLTETALVARSRPLPSLRSDELENPEKTRSSARAVWVPNRNGLFLNVAACFADQGGASVILTGFNREEAQTFPDNSAAFVEAMNRSLSFSTQVRVRVEAPSQGMNKEEIVREGLLLNLPFEKLWSCYEGGETLCGTCESCLRSQRAYQAAGLWDRMKDFFER